MWLAHKVTNYSNATILKTKWFQTIISGHSLELCATQTAQRSINHTLSNSAHFPSGFCSISLPFGHGKVIYFLAVAGFAGFQSLVQSLNLLYLSKNMSHTENKLENFPKCL